MTLKGLSSKAGSIATIVTALGLLVVGVRAYDAMAQERQANSDKLEMHIQEAERRHIDYKVEGYQRDRAELTERITSLAVKVRLGTITSDEIEDLAEYEAERELVGELISFTIGDE